MQPFNSIFEKKNVEYEISATNTLPFSLSNVVFPSGKNQPPNYSAYYNNFFKKLEENDFYLEQMTLNVKDSRNVPGGIVTNSENVVLNEREGKKFVLTSNLEPQVQVVHKVVSEIADSLSSVPDLDGMIVNFVLYDDSKYVAGTQNGLYCAKKLLDKWEKVGEEDWFVRSFSNYNCKACTRNEYQNIFNNELDKFQYFLGTNGGLFALQTNDVEKRYWVKLHGDLLDGNQINVLKLDSFSKRLFIGTNNGLYSTDGEKLVLENSTEDIQIQTVDFLDNYLLKQRMENMLVGTPNGMLQSQEGQYPKNFELISSFLNLGEINSIDERNGTIYAALSTSLVSIDKDGSRILETIPGNQPIRQVAVSENGKIFYVANYISDAPGYNEFFDLFQYSQYGSSNYNFGNTAAEIRGIVKTEYENIFLLYTDSSLSVFDANSEKLISIPESFSYGTIDKIENLNNGKIVIWSRSSSQSNPNSFRVYNFSKHGRMEIYGKEMNGSNITGIDVAGDGNLFVSAGDLLQMYGKTLKNLPECKILKKIDFDGSKYYVLFTDKSNNVCFKTWSINSKNEWVDETNILENFENIKTFVIKTSSSGASGKYIFYLTETELIVKNNDEDFSFVAKYTFPENVLDLTVLDLNNIFVCGKNTLFKLTMEDRQRYDLTKSNETFGIENLSNENILEIKYQNAVSSFLTMDETGNRTISAMFPTGTLSSIMTLSNEISTVYFEPTIQEKNLKAPFYLVSPLSSNYLNVSTMDNGESFSVKNNHQVRHIHGGTYTLNGIYHGKIFLENGIDIGNSLSAYCLEYDFDEKLSTMNNVAFNKDFSFNGIPYAATTSGLYAIFSMDGQDVIENYYSGNNIKDIQFCDNQNIGQITRYFLGNGLSVTYSDFYENSLLSATTDSIAVSNVDKILKNSSNNDLFALSVTNYDEPKSLICLTSKTPTLVLNYQVTGTSCDLNENDIFEMFNSGLSSEVLSSTLSLHFIDDELVDTSCNFKLSFDFSSTRNDTFGISSVTIFDVENNEDFLSVTNMNYQLVSSYYESFEYEDDKNVSTYYVLNLNLSTDLSLNLDNYAKWDKSSILNVVWNSESDISNHVFVSNVENLNPPLFNEIEEITDSVNDIAIGNNCLLAMKNNEIISIDLMDYSENSTIKDFGGNKVVQFSGNTYCLDENGMSCFNTNTIENVSLEENDYVKLAVSDSGNLFGFSKSENKWFHIVNGTTPYHDSIFKITQSFNGNFWNNGTTAFIQNENNLDVCKSRPCYDINNSTLVPNVLGIDFEQNKSLINGKSLAILWKTSNPTTIYYLGLGKYKNGILEIDQNSKKEIFLMNGKKDLLKLTNGNVVLDYGLSTFYCDLSSVGKDLMVYDYSSSGRNTTGFVKMPGLNSASGGVLNDIFYSTDNGIYDLNQTAVKSLTNSGISFSHSNFNTSKFYPGNILMGSENNVLSVFKLNASLEVDQTSSFNLEGVEGTNYGFANGVPFYISATNFGMIGNDLSVSPQPEILSSCIVYNGNPIFAGNKGFYKKTFTDEGVGLVNVMTMTYSTAQLPSTASFSPYGVNFVNDDLSSLVYSFGITSQDFDFFYLSSSFEDLLTQIDSPVKSILKDKNGNLYFYNNDFFSIYDTEKGYFNVNLPSGYDASVVGNLITGTGDNILMTSGNKIFKFYGTEIQRKFDKPKDDYSIFRKKFYNKDIRAVEKLDDKNFLIGTADSARYVKDLKLSLEPTDFEDNVVLSGPVNTIKRFDREVENGFETRYLYTSGRDVYSSSNNIELTKETTLSSDIMGVNSVYSPAGGSLYCICTNDGLFVAEPGYILENDLKTYNILKIKNLQTELLSNDIDYHIMHDHNADSFLSALDAKCPAKLDEIPLGFTTNNKIGLFNEVEVIKNDIVESIEFNDANKFVKASVKNWATDILNGTNVYSEAGFIDHFIDPYDGEEIDLSEIPYVCKFWNSGLKEFVIYVPTTLTYYINNPKGFTNSIYNTDSIVRKNVSNSFSTENTISSKCTTLQILLANTHFKIKNIHNVQINGNSLPLRIYKDSTYCQKGRENLFDTVIQPSVLNSLPVLENQVGVNNTTLMENSNNIILTFSIYGTDAQSIRILAE